MSGYRRKPILVEAEQWGGVDKPLSIFKIEHELGTGEPQPDIVFNVPHGKIWKHGGNLYVGTLQGSRRIDPGDWLVRIGTEIFSCSNAVFTTQYEPV